MNQPTRRFEFDDLPVRFYGSARPYDNDLLWFRMRHIYAPVVVTDPKSVLKVTSCV
jgi:hypothetical protein